MVNFNLLGISACIILLLCAVFLVCFSPSFVLPCCSLRVYVCVCESMRGGTYLCYAIDIQTDID